MSFFLPYTPFEVLHYFEGMFELDLSLLSPYEVCMLTMISNIFFFAFWFFIIYFSLKGINWVYERLF